MAISMEHLVEAMMRMTENVNRLVEAQNGNNNRKSGYWDDMTKYKNLKVFSGDQKEWEEFQCKLKGQVGAGDPKVLNLIEEIEAGAEATAEEENWALVGDESHTEEAVEEISKKLHNVLLSLTTKEANAVVRRCRGNGLWAWKRLSSTLNPRTLASGIKMISSVLNPNKITHAAKADIMIEEWEDRMKKLQTEYTEEISAKMKVAVLYAMLPKDLQERVLDKCAVNWDSTKESDAENTYSKVREEIKNIAKSRRDMVTPKPMEVDQVYRNHYWTESGKQEPKVDVDAEDGDKDDEDWEDENNINYVGKGDKGKGKGRCWTCGEFGHRAFECPKGGGKGGKGWGGKSWADGKEGKGGKGHEAKGQSKGVRACFHCGATDHLMRDCPRIKNSRVHEVTAEEQEEPEILFIGNVSEKRRRYVPHEGEERMGSTAPTDPTPRRTATLGDFIKPKLGAKPKQKVAPPPGLGGRKTMFGFEALAEETDDVEECSIGNIEVGEPEEMLIRSVDNAVNRKKGAKAEWASLGVGDIVVDSAADESCWPQGQGDAYEVKPSRRRILLRAANGSEMAHYGEKHITIRGPDGEPLGLRFQVTDVRKPLLAVRRLVECGNEIMFGADDSHIKNTLSGKKIPLIKKGGSWVIRAEFVKNLAAAADFTRQVTDTE